MSAKRTGLAGLTIGALGVVFGDIGTSPLYAVQAIFGANGQQLAINRLTVYGIISLIIWSLLLIVTIKFIAFIMRADNEGEGGIMALVGLIKGSPLSSRLKWTFVLFGIIGVSLFYGDSAITPAISVLSAVEGLAIVAPHFGQFVIPIALMILLFLFWVQQRGTNFIGHLFGPVMFVWFGVIGIGGGWQILQHPDALHALSPLAAWQFAYAQPLHAAVAMGAVVLAITGAEALYADMGHFGRGPIARAWLYIVFPALILCYMGQGALLVAAPNTTQSPFFLIFPEAARFTIVILATIATLIASQSVISGAFSLTRQAVQLGFMPKMLIRHTSIKEAGQVYVPFVNFVLCVTVILLILIFRSSAALGHAYGIAVSGTLAIDTLLFLVVMRVLWRKSLLTLLATILVFVPIDLVFLVTNIPKILQGGWFPILIGILVLAFIYTWLRGQRIITHERHALEGSLEKYVDDIYAGKPPIIRLPGQAVYISHHPGYAPLAMHATAEKLHELHEKVVIISVQTSSLAHVAEKDRAVFNDLKRVDGISQVTLTYGFHDVHNIPKTLQSIRHLSPELDFDPAGASYFISLSKVVPTTRHNMSRWQKSLYALMSRNELSASDYYKLPIERTVELRSLIPL